MSEEQVQEQQQEPKIPVPPASFSLLTQSIRFQTEMQLGLLHFGPESEREKPDLQAARHSIDLLSILQEKTKGNLTMDEQRLLENTLTELRFRYVQVFEESKKS